MEFQRFLLLSVFLLAVLGGLVVAHEEESDEHHVDTVIIASTENYPDALVAGSAASKLGVPILLTEKDSVPEETRSALEEFSPSEVILVGGTAVISENVQNDLSTSYNVTRLWGTTRYGTSGEVAEKFWVEGSDHAILVQNSIGEERGLLLAAAKELAREEDEPVYLTPEDKVPAAILSSMNNLGVQSVTIVGAGITDSYRDDITSAGITIEEEITGQSEEEVRERIEDRLRRDINASNTLVAVASSASVHTTAASNFPRSVVFHVTDDDDIEELVTVVNDNDISRVKVVGQPGLAGDAAESLREDTDAEVVLIVGGDEEAIRINANLTGGERPDFARVHRQRIQHLRDIRRQQLQHIQERANESINRADDIIDENSSQEAQDLLQEAKTHYSAGEYEEAWEKAHEARNEVREERFERIRGNATAIQEEIAEETEDLQEKIDELRELNREFAEEMQENMTAEERLEVIEEFRDERKEIIRELMEEARKTEGDIGERLRDAKREVRDREGHQRFRFSAECTDESSGSIELVRRSITGHDGRIRADGRLTLPTPNYRADASFEDPAPHELVMDVRLQERDSFGIQCVSAAKFRYEVDTSAGNWTVTLNVNVGDREIASVTEEVTVTPDDDDDEMEKDDRMEDDMMETDINPKIRAPDQPFERGTLYAAGYIDHPGYVVMHLSEDGSPGTVVGHSDLIRGTFGTAVPVNTSYGTNDYFAMLHYDDGDGNYEFPGNDSPVTLEGEIVQDRFHAEASDTADSETLPTEYRLASTDGEGCDTQTFYYDGEAVDVIQMPAGKEITVTFAPREGCTYSGGAEFYSVPDSVFGESEAIQGGETTNVSFVAEEDFVIEQWWPDEAVMKADLAVDVQ